MTRRRRGGTLDSPRVEEVGAVLTLSIIKADTGGFVGHSAMHPDMLALAEDALSGAVGDLLIDGQASSCGDDLHLLMTHRHGVDADQVHSFAWDVFQRTTELARELGLYGAGQDILSDAFSGNLRGMGPGYAEIEFEERPSETVLCFLADKTEPGAWNLPLYRMFGDPFNTAGLVIDPKMHKGFAFEVHDLFENRRVTFELPGEMHDLLLYIGAPSRYVVKQVTSRTLEEVAAVTSTQRLALMAGRYVGKDDPVMIVRAQSGLPAVGEVLEPFAFPHTVAGCMRGSHHAPLMPVSVGDAHPSRFDGPPRVVCLGFQITGGRFIGPRDMLADPSFDRARAQAGEVMDYLRRHGPFEPHRLPLDEMEYTTMPAVAEQLADRWTPIPGAVPVATR
jgi:fructose 1,6-bisphosphate aldolase/phosphatase